MQATATRFPLNVDAQDLPTISQSTFDFYVLAAGYMQTGGVPLTVSHLGTSQRLSSQLFQDNQL